MDAETANATPISPVSCKITMRGHDIIQDKPAEYGGDDKGPMASEILMASLLACQLSTFAKIAKKRGVEATVDDIQAECHFDDAGDISKITVAWKLRGVDDKAAATLVRLTDKVCTISRVLKCEVETRFETA